MQTTYQPPAAKGRLALLALALWAVGLIGFGPTLIREAVVANRSERAEDAAQVNYEIPEAGFSAIFPTEPIRREEGSDGSLVVYLSGLPGDEGNLGVAVSPWPGKTDVSAADSLRAYALTWVEAKGTLVTSAEASVQSHPAMDMVIDAKGGRMFVRMIHVAGAEPRRYLLLTSDDPSAELKEAFNRMVTSFRLIDQPPAAS